MARSRVGEYAGSVEHLLSESRTFPPPNAFREKANVSSEAEYASRYRQSLDDTETFWLSQARALSWFRLPTRALEYCWDGKNDRVEHSWFADGVINVSVNCLDRHLGTSRCDKTAIVWQGDAPEEQEHWSYRKLHEQVCRFSNSLKELGVAKGDRVCIYLPMIPEAAVAMLACARIGAIHSVVFGGFSAESLRNRIVDSSCKLVVTANASRRGGKTISLKAIVDEALCDCPSVEKVIVVRRLDESCLMTQGRDVWADELMVKASPECSAEELSAEDPLFILYTSGSTGQPKGVVHSQGGYLLQAALTHKILFDVKDEDIYWCTADIGWVTGHSYIVYGPLANGATTMMFEGIPTYPDPSRFWQEVERHGVTLFYTAPTALRALMAHGEKWTKKADLSSLRLLGTVGEPINPEAWMWYHSQVGGGRCPIVDTWWQTETGGIMLSSWPGVHAQKPGSAGRPFLGVEPVILRDDGNECSVDEGGSLCIKRPWPGIMRTTWGDHQRFIDTYFKQFEGCYCAGDSARCDADGDYWLMGRLDDVVNVSGHRMGTAEVESALVSHSAVAEAAVVPIPHKVKGQALVAFVTLIDGCDAGAGLEAELVQHVAKEIGPIAKPDRLLFTSALPKTRSGKIMRRILRKLASGESDQLGDTSTLSNPEVVDELIEKF